MYRKALLRETDDRKLTLATRYRATGPLSDFAHALLCTNEEIFWP